MTAIWCGDPTWIAPNFELLKMCNFNIYVVHLGFGAILGDPKFGSFHVESPHLMAVTGYTWLIVVINSNNELCSRSNNTVSKAFWWKFSQNKRSPAVEWFTSSKVPQCKNHWCPCLHDYYYACPLLVFDRDYDIWMILNSHTKDNEDMWRSGHAFCDCSKNVLWPICDINGLLVFFLELFIKDCDINHFCKFQETKSLKLILERMKENYNFMWPCLFVNQ